MMNQKDNLPGLSRGWVWTRLGEIAEINPKFLENNLNDGTEVSFLPMKTVEERTGKVDLSHIRKVSEVKKGYTSFRDGDILFAKITPCMENGKIAVVNNLKNGIGFGSTEFHVIHLSNLIDEKLLFFFLLQDDYRKTAQRSMTGSAGQLRVPVYFVENTVFPLPPLQEQQRIIAKIEELFTRLDAGVEALKKTKAQLKRYRQAVLKHAFEGRLTEEWREAHKGKVEPASILLERIKEERKRNAKDKRGHRVIARSERNEAISEDGIASAEPALSASEGARNDNLPTLPEGWVWTRVGEISKKIHYGYTVKSTDEKIGPKLLRITDIQNNSVNWDTVPYCNILQEDKEKYLLHEGDLVFARTGATVGKSFLIFSKIPETVFASYLIRIVLYDEISNKFIYNYFQSLSYWQQISSGKLGIGQPNVNAEKLSRIVLPLPPLAEQHKVVEEIERCLSVADGMEKTIGQSLKQAERVRQSILKRAFEGKLVPQDPCDEPASVLLEKIKLLRQQIEQRTKTRRRKASG